MEYGWNYILDVAYLSLFLGIATYLKRTIKFFQKYLIPNAMIAGFIGLILGPEILKLVDFNIDRLGNLIYHLMSIGFIALALKERQRDKGSKEVINTGLFIVSTYLIQGILGFALSLLVAFTVMPSLFPPMGLLLPLSFGQGPGQAFSIGRSWEPLGFANGGNVGLSFAAIGFLWACFGGIPLMNYLIRRKKMMPEKSGQHDIPRKDQLHEMDDPNEIPLSESIDRISVQFFLIGIVYLVTYFTLRGCDLVLVNFGTFGKTLATLLWGFSFIIGSLYAILLRIILDYFKKKNIMIRNYPNNFLLQRIAGGSFDFMITAAIAAISVKIFVEYALPTLVITTLGGILTIWFTVFMCKKIYKKNVLENIMGLYGTMTGVISSGMALLREVDPGFDSRASENLVLGSGAGLVVGFPLMIVLNIPVLGAVQNQPIMYLYGMLAFIVYFAALMFLMYLNNRKRKVKA